MTTDDNEELCARLLGYAYHAVLGGEVDRAADLRAAAERIRVLEHYLEFGRHPDEPDRGPGWVVKLSGKINTPTDVHPSYTFGDAVDVFPILHFGTTEADRE